MEHDRALGAALGEKGSDRITKTAAPNESVTMQHLDGFAAPVANRGL